MSIASFPAILTFFYSRIFSPVENKFQTSVPMMYNTTATLNTSSQEPIERRVGKNT